MVPDVPCAFLTLNTASFFLHEIFGLSFSKQSWVSLFFFPTKLKQALPASHKPKNTAAIFVLGYELG
jgi:hypothetical protein